MTTYTLKLVSGVNYNLYNGTTLVSDADLATLFGSAGSAFFVFDFNGGTPTNTTDLTIVDSNSQAVITNTGLSGIAENTNFNGDWSASATAFDVFVKSPAAVLDEAQMSDLMGKIKAGSIKMLTAADYNHHSSGNTDDGVALWLLDPGYYIFGQGVYYYANVQLNKSVAVTGSYAIVSGKTAGRCSVITTTHGNPPRAFSYSSTGEYDSNNRFLNLTVVDNLTSSGSNVPLSASQGKVLADRIGTLSALTTTAKTSAVAAINEVNGKAVGTSETLTIATTDWTALSASAPYDYSATVTATTTISATSTVELINDQAVLFGTYGFAIGSISGQSITFYSIGQPSASVSLTIKVRS